MSEETTSEGEELKKEPPKEDTSLVPRLWDSFSDGLHRGVPGIDTDFDIGVNRPPWEKD